MDWLLEILAATSEKNVPPQQRRILGLVLRGYPHREIAALLDCSLGNVAKHIECFCILAEADSSLDLVRVVACRIDELASGSPAGRGPEPFPSGDDFLLWLEDVLCASAKITPREREVLRLRLLGRRYEEIADALGIAPDTVKAHLHAVYRALGVGSSLDLLRVVTRRLTEQAHAGWSESAG